MLKKLQMHLNKASIGFYHTETYSIGKQNSLTTHNEALPNHNEDLCVCVSKLQHFFRLKLSDSLPRFAEGCMLFPSWFMHEFENPLGRLVVLFVLPAQKQGKNLDF